MSKPTLYEFAVLHHPKAEKKDERAPESRIVVKPEYILARGEQEAAMRAARAIPEELADKLDEVEIIIRPFS